MVYLKTFCGRASSLALSGLRWQLLDNCQHAPLSGAAKTGTSTCDVHETGIKYAKSGRISQLIL